jgi:tRNA G10  N-methylase Trm11
MVIETSSQIYLTETLERDQNDQYLHQTDTQQFRDVWTKRPFQYSGAINLDLAITITDVLGPFLFKYDTMPKTIRLLDPTCGSGTFLALAVSTWGELANLELVGVDSNPKCAAGTVSNLVNIFSIGDNEVDCDLATNKCSITFPSDDYFPKQSVATIVTGDSSQLEKTAFDEPFDCAVANLPWNRNTFEFEGSDSSAGNKASSHTVNTGILKSVASALKPRAPIVVISADSMDGVNCDKGSKIFDAQTCLEDFGFEVLGLASVPPKGFVLPESKKGTGFLSKRLKGSSHCSIVIALAP